MKKFNERYSDSGNPKVRLSEKEYQIIQDFRRVQDEAEKAGVNPDDVKHLWLKNKNSRLFVKNPNFKTEVYNKFKDDLINDLKNHSPKYSKIKRKKQKDGHLLVIDPADIHIGKLSTAYEIGKEYNTQIAIDRVHEGVKGILNKSNGFNIEKILFVAGNDILHTDNPKRQTTSGTPQDTDGMWYNNFLAAKQLYVDVLEHLMSFADVQFMFNPSNHDYQSGFFLSDTIKTWFRNSNNITFDSSISHRKYFKYHSNLIATTHGDGCKMATLPMVVADEAAKYWSLCKHRYIYTHHVHHKTAKDFPGITQESLRSPSEADSWHHRNGYQSSNNVAIEGFIHHPENGQVARLTHYF
mgnify:FL=1